VNFPISTNNAHKLKNPYPGLRPFEFDERYLFFGREGQADDLLHRLYENGFVAVLGLSGCGKSSLVRAGLVPLLFGSFSGASDSSWRVALMRPGDDPIKNLATSLANAGLLFETDRHLQGREKAIEKQLRQNSHGLLNVYGQRGRHSRYPRPFSVISDVTEDGGQPSNESSKVDVTEKLLVIVDQFEEIFRFHQEKDRNEDANTFIRLLVESVSKHEGVYVLLTMRSEFLGEAASFRDLPELINTSQYLVPRMSRSNLELAVNGPMNVVEVPISPVLVNALLNELGDRPDELPVLQHALMRSFTQHLKRSRDGSLDLTDYKNAGGMEEAISHHADEIMKELGADNEPVVERLFKCLTDYKSGQYVRRPQTLASICSITGYSSKELKPVIDAFRRPECSFLLPGDKKELTGDTVIDITHESLIRLWQDLTRWAKDEREAAKIFQQLNATVSLYPGFPPALVKLHLANVVRWREQNQPNEAWAKLYVGVNDTNNFAKVISFIGLSEKIANRQRYAKIAAVVVPIVLIGCWLGYSYVQASIDRAKLAKQYDVLKSDLQKVEMAVGEADQNEEDAMESLSFGQMTKAREYLKKADSENTNYHNLGAIYTNVLTEKLAKDIESNPQNATLKTYNLVNEITSKYSKSLKYSSMRRLQTVWAVTGLFSKRSETRRICLNHLKTNDIIRMRRYLIPLLCYYTDLNAGVSKEGVSAALSVLPLVDADEVKKNKLAIQKLLSTCRITNPADVQNISDDLARIWKAPSRAKDQRSTKNPSAGSASSLWKEAQKDRIEGRWEDAGSKYEQIVKLKPKDYLAHYWCGYCQANLQMWDKALAAFNECLSLNSSCSDAYRGRGYVTGRQDRSGNSGDIGNFKTAILLNKNDRWAHLYLALAYIHGTNDFNNAVRGKQELDETIKRFPDFEAAYYVRYSLPVQLGGGNQADLRKSRLLGFDLPDPLPFR
jgi:tetratricopeptide (TPR) repeat protein